MAPSTPLSIATGAVQRLVKEEASYQREKKDQEQRLEKLSKETSDDENREYMLNQEVGPPLSVYSSGLGVFTYGANSFQRKALEETEKLLPQLKMKINEAVAKLERLLAEEGQKGVESDVAQITAAKEAISNAKTAIREIS
ncbi:tubulin-specific chaperone Rbl2 [Trichophyton tonsurans CBS 112818]|uniref:Tubulin-specific chaperone A n=2 Tax=Trichophyton TaxID=5550 RepID=F2PPJ9_TRIEC|nr:tubulin-specific chaperone Rbl2 [Trichophyton tonsurans CBS 112818]EGE03817.1 tubulin-specific chaperone Rbl2 [Trichophyton equinum CBS 127.97]